MIERTLSNLVGGKTFAKFAMLGIKSIGLTIILIGYYVTVSSYKCWRIGGLGDNH